MNDVYRELKARLRRLDALLVQQGLSNVALAQALSRARRAERHGDRSREPTVALRALLEDAEGVARKSA